MAAALFADQATHHGDSVDVSSAGLLRGGREVPDEVLEVMSGRGIDLSGHRSRTLTAEMLAGVDLVVGMGRRHVQEAVLLDPASWPRAFKLKELVRRGHTTGPRRPGQGIRAWIETAHGDRTRADLARRSDADEVDDPYGGPLAGYRSTAAELDRLAAGLVGLLWPGGMFTGLSAGTCGA